MANTNVYTGADGSISLSSPEGLEGEQAQAVIDANDLVSVGRVQGVTVEVTSDLKPFHEIGSRYATELRPGNVTVTGTIGRAYVNGALLKMLLGEASESRPSSNWNQPAFNMSLLVENVARPGVRNTVTLHGVKISNWNYSIPEDDFVMESANFQALSITVGDEE
ncbi:MAG: hypothetical protein JKY24_03490 [Pseudomonadales bacterium]|nr:hypothetical protein [Pseudomonadales bacterium]